MGWTTEQQQAIEARGGTLLVSAAAGSGKTAVLVERVIGRLTDAQNRCSPEELLIVTFTIAATAQMRDRISAAFESKLSDDPTNSYLLHQQTMLPFSQICTIDSFCSTLVRENFQELNISPNYKILDSEENDILQNETASEVIEELYEENSDEFKELVELLFEGRDDKGLTSAILTLNNRADANPFPEEWLSSLCEPFNSTVSIKESEWGKTVLDHVKSTLGFCIETAEKLIEYAKTDDIVYEKYTPTLVSDIAIYKKLLNIAENGTWDELYEAVNSNIKFDRIGTISKYDSPQKSIVKSGRDTLKSMVNKLSPKICVTEDENSGDLLYCASVIKKFTEVVMLFRTRLFEKKKDINSYGFSDITAFALRLLISKDENGKITKTPLAKELSDHYIEILVDEYQDINSVQDMLFKAISRDESNLFMVGDVKQSIYRFRQAMPEIFLRHRDKLSTYENENYPAKISLGCNFRSRTGVADAINFIFSQIMSKEAGEVDYNSGEALVPMASYKKKDCADAEIHLLDMLGENGNNTTREAGYIAELIKNMISDGLTVKSGDSERRASYKDFCILLRGDSGRFSKFTEEFTRRNVPVYANVKGGFFEASEINFMLSLMQVLDNPSQDIPLISVMLSPVYGFSTDDLAKLRISDRKSNIYDCLCEMSESDEKCKAFVENLRMLRRLSSTLAAGELVRRLLEETGYLAVAGAMTVGSRRRANLMLLQELASKYEQSGHIGLSGFIRFIEKLKESNNKLNSASAVSETADVVTIMTVHNSKGLEFPVCILANCTTPFNDRDLYKKYVINSQEDIRLGIGVKRRDRERLTEYETLNRVAVTLAAKRSAHSEEMRVLYVALTRAKERLITVLPVKNVSSALSNAAINSIYGRELPPAAVLNMNCYSDWILSAVLRHPDAHVFRETAGVDGSLAIIPASFSLKTVIGKLPDGKVETVEEYKTGELNEQLLSKIDERLTYRYPYESLTGVVAKHTASKIDENGINREYFASSRPAFMSSRGLTPAQRGTAMHRFMQYADYHRAANDAGAELERLTAEGYFTEAEKGVIDLSAAERFFKCEVAKRMLSSEHIFREKRFTISKGVREFYPELPDTVADEEIIIQGMVDCAFVENGNVIILDYKTDKAAPEELLKRYSDQLIIYRDAMEACTEMTVSELYLYSFYNGTTIKIQPTNP